MQIKIFGNGKVNIMGMEEDSYTTNTGCYIIVGKENGLWHLSISHHDRYPTWDEIHKARYSLLSRSKNFAMLLPPPEQYVNANENCFHLYELTEKEIKNIQKAKGGEDGRI